MPLVSLNTANIATRTKVRTKVRVGLLLASYTPAHTNRSYAHPNAAEWWHDADHTQRYTMDTAAEFTYKPETDLNTINLHLTYTPIPQ